MSWWRMLAAALATALVVLTGGAGAQLNPLRDFELSGDDIALLTAAADRLYEAGEIGGIARWSNPHSGNAGTVEILEIFEREGLPCRRVEHVIELAEDPVPKRLMLASCRVEDGRWLLV
jgi:surface antigen